MEEFRCKFCHRLLAKVEDAALVEVKCPKCKTMNLYCHDRAALNMAIIKDTEKGAVGEAYHAPAAAVPHQYKH